MNEEIPAHGGDIYRAGRFLKCRPEEVLDFSANVNPLGLSPLAIKAIREGFSGLDHYPDPECYDLREAIASYHGISPGMIGVGNGATELIYLAVSALKIRRACIPLPTFAEYGRAVQAVDGEIFPVFTRRDEGYRWRPADLEVHLRIHRADALFLCHPNNPTGALHHREELFQVIGRAVSLGVWVVVDEAFIDWREDASLVGLMFGKGDPPENLLILRSLTKFFGLAGLRIGYLAASPAAAARVRRHQPPWSVNHLAQVAAVESLRDREFREKSLTLIEEEREFLFSGLGGIPGLHPLPSSANYLLVEMTRDGLTSADLTRRLREDRILIRGCRSFPGLEGEYIRVAVRRREENERLLGSLRKHLKGTEESR